MGDVREKAAGCQEEDKDLEKRASETWSVRVSLNLRENKMFWKVIDSVRKTREPMGTSV